MHYPCTLIIINIAHLLFIIIIIIFYFLITPCEITVSICFLAARATKMLFYIIYLPNNVKNNRVYKPSTLIHLPQIVKNWSLAHFQLQSDKKSLFFNQSLLHSWMRHELCNDTNPHNSLVMINVYDTFNHWLLILFRYDCIWNELPIYNQLNGITDVVGWWHPSVGVTSLQDEQWLSCCWCYQASSVTTFVMIRWRSFFEAT